MIVVLVDAILAFKTLTLPRSQLLKESFLSFTGIAIVYHTGFLETTENLSEVLYIWSLLSLQTLTGYHKSSPVDTNYISQFFSDRGLDHCGRRSNLSSGYLTSIIRERVDFHDYTR